MIQWFKRHQRFLIDESTALSNDSNYREVYQHRDKLLISHGYVIVRLNKIHRFPILVVYTDATPYRLPIVYPLKAALTKDQIIEMAGLPIDELYRRVKEHVQFYYELRHQNSSGELCALERENLDSGSSFYGISTILQRVRDWYAGQITKEFPPDSEEVDFCAHFNFIDKEIKILYPEQFYISQVTEGDCYATIYGVHPAGKYFLHAKYLYTGIYLDGLGASGLYEQVNINLERHFLHPKLNNSIDLSTNSDIVEKLIEEKKLLKAQWFQINHEPKPFESFKDLVSIIGNNDYDAGIKRIAARCKDTFKQIPDTFLLAIRFPNRKGKMEFQMFKVYEAANPPEFIIQITEEKKIRAILERFDKVEAIEGEKVTEETFHQRNSTRADYNILKYSFVNILGVGAIGSEIADCVAKAGVGNIRLFDDQLLKAHNTVRHLGNLDQIGEPKVSVVAEILYKHNPFINVRISSFNLYNIDIVTDDFSDESIFISSVADDNVEGFINQQLVISNKTAFYVRALRGGKTARIFRVIPGKDACFHCLSLYRNDKTQFIDIPEDTSFLTLKNECNNPIRPASAADLKFVSSIASRILIDYIQEKEAPFNHWIWTSEEIPETPLQTPYHFHRQIIPPHRHCPYCKHDRHLTIIVKSDALNFMQSLIQQNPEIETGGVLAGFLNESGDIIITDASEPGPKAIKSATKFEKDIEFCQSFLDKLFTGSDKKIVYVGEWHSHPSLNNRPSGTDLKSLSEISVQENYLTENPAMIIFSNKGEPSCTIHPAGKRYYFAKLLIEDI